MTTLAANRTSMSADSFITDGNRTVKMMKGRGIIVGYAGDIFYGTALAQWVIKGREGPMPAPPADGFLKDDEKASETALLILRRTGLSIMDGRGTEVPIDGDYAADGSGRDVALGALWAGRSPEDAVRAACEHDANTKPPIHTLTLGRTKT